MIVLFFESKLNAHVASALLFGFRAGLNEMSDNENDPVDGGANSNSLACEITTADELLIWSIMSVRAFISSVTNGRYSSAYSTQ
jgi:hypothetical protein